MLLGSRGTKDTNMVVLVVERGAIPGFHDLGKHGGVGALQNGTSAAQAVHFPQKGFGTVRMTSIAPRLDHVLGDGVRVRTMRFKTTRMPEFTKELFSGRNVATLTQ